jgi:hypothetical protein
MVETGFRQAAVVGRVARHGLRPDTWRTRRRRACVVGLERDRGFLGAGGCLGLVDRLTYQASLVSAAICRSVIKAVGNRSCQDGKRSLVLMRGRPAPARANRTRPRSPSAPSGTPTRPGPALGPEHGPVLL